MLRCFFAATLLLISCGSIDAFARSDSREAGYSHGRDYDKSHRDKTYGDRSHRNKSHRNKSDRIKARWQNKRSRVCDPLRESSTGGLYGLCVAYCEVQDSATPGDATSKRAIRKQRFLDKYNERKTASDPSMPCVQTASACPCWTNTQAQVSFWTDKPGGGTCNSFTADNLDALSLVSNTAWDDPTYTSLSVSSYAEDGTNFTHYCSAVEGAMSSNVVHELSDVELLTCQAQLSATCSVLNP